MYLFDYFRALAADSFIQLGFAIAPTHYLESLIASVPEE